MHCCILYNFIKKNQHKIINKIQNFVRKTNNENKFHEIRYVNYLYNILIKSCYHLKKNTDPLHWKKNNGVFELNIFLIIIIYI